MSRRPFVIADVFTDQPYSGNQLAVVFDADGLTKAQMQAIATEFGFSETTFVLRPERDDHDVRVRIFTPGVELPFAGHPTVGTALALAWRRDPDERPHDVFFELALDERAVDEAASEPHRRAQKRARPEQRGEPVRT